MSIRPARIRAATVGDLDWIVELEREVFAADAWSRDQVADEIAAGHICVADRDGYVATQSIGDSVDLTRIAVASAVRRTGRASGLLRAVLPTRTPMLLEVSERNTGAIAFYRRHGFSELDRRPKYYRDGAAAVVMRWRPDALVAGSATE